MYVRNELIKKYFCTDQFLNGNKNDWSRVGPKWRFLQRHHELSSRRIEIIMNDLSEDNPFGSDEYLDLYVKGIMIYLTALKHKLSKFDTKAA